MTIMSGEWELVCKPKKSKANVPNGEDSKSKKGRKVPEQPTRVEDILPKHQVQSLYTKENRKRIENNNVAHDTPKKVVAKPVKPVAKKGVSIPHKPKPKNVEAGLAALDIGELQSLLESHKISFVDSHLVWLKGISSYINTNINIETDPTFNGKPPSYPSSAVPTALKTIILNTLCDSGVANVQYFFDQSLTTLAVDLSKNNNCVGHKIMLQLIAFDWPFVCVNNLAKNAILRNSYQNRSSIGLSLLWALGQGGYKDLSVGLKVWQNIMVPVLDIKAYTKFVSEYIHRISQKGENITLLQEEFFTIFDELTLQRNGIAKDYQKLLNESAAVILIKYVKSATKVTNIFVTLFKRLTHFTTFSLYPALIECIIKDRDCLKVWKMNYKKNVTESNMLFRHLEKNWSNTPIELKHNLPLQVFLSDISKIIETIPVGKLDAAFNETTRLITVLQEKTVQKKGKKSSSICPWLFGSFLLFVIIAALVAYDTHIHNGVFAKSSTGQFLKKTGTLSYVEVGWTKSMSTCARGYQWAEKHGPVYVNQVYVALKPYGEFTKDLIIVSWNSLLNRWDAAKEYASQKTPILVNFVEQYAPGLPQKIQDVSISTWSIVCSTSSHVYTSGYEFFKTKVFVGNFSPENLCNVFNQTQNAAAQYYSWFHQKVDRYAKIQ